ncbi:MAG: hypothetical protein K0R29_2069 [Pseudobdellovibrio sp.]|jgi:predicted restriction endonuclease|nr:hypothetical protein [Pseudobdellovibrio sp.]
MKHLVFILIFTFQALAFANPKAKQLMQLYFNENALTEAFVEAFIKGKTEEQLKNYRINPEAFRRLVKSNYTHVLLRDGADSIAHLKDPELNQIIAFLKTPAGEKVREVQLKKHSKPVTEILTKEELAAADKFYKSYAGIIWDTALRKIVDRMYDPKGHLTRKTIRVLHKYLNQKDVQPEHSKS